MNIVFSENNGEYLNKNNVEMISSSEKQNIMEIAEKVDKEPLINTKED